MSEAADLPAPARPPRHAPPRPAAGSGPSAEAPYQSLYRRFRPQRFAEVRGQDHVTTALRNAVRDGKVAHAYLFSGPRGTGKTSTARILAKALNCQALDDGEPCGRCDSCVAIAAGTSFDVHELDAASSNGVDAMRDLVARAALATPGRWKVYIVDEVHMLSAAASNALLKTLEEPPEHVVFVLATTDPQKVLPTVRSRTQHYEFHLLDHDVLASLLSGVADEASLSLPSGALEVALRRGRGSARDALSALDQVVAAGVVDEEGDALRDVVGALAGRDSTAVLVALDRAVRAGRDPQQVAVDLIERLRAGFLAVVAPSLLTAADGGESEVAALGPARCVRAMEVIGTAIVAMRDAPEPRITLETALIRCSHPEADDSPAAIVERLERLERRVAELAQGQRGPAATPQATPPPPPPPPPRATSPAPPAGARPALGAYRRTAEAESPTPPDSAPRRPEPPEATPPSAVTERADPSELPAAPERDELVTAWGDHVLGRLRPKVRAVYQAIRFLDNADGEAVLAVPNAAHLTHAEPLRGEVAAALAAHFGRPVPMRLVVDEAAIPAGAEPPVRQRSAARPRQVAAAEAATELEETAELDEEELASQPPGAPAPGVTWAEASVLRAFPGAEEVRP